MASTSGAPSVQDESRAQPDARRDWVLSVLGVDIAAARPAAKPTAAAATAKTLPVWRDAIEAVGSDITALQVKMRDIGHPALIRVADQGLGPFTKNLQVGLHVALMEFDSGGAGHDKARRKAQSAIADFRRFLDSDPLVPLLARNPFGVALDMKSRLGAALTAIEASLNA